MPFKVIMGEMLFLAKHVESLYALGKRVRGEMFTVSLCISCVRHSSLLWRTICPKKRKKKNIRKIGIFKSILFSSRLLPALLCKPLRATHHCEFGALKNLI